MRGSPGLLECHVILRSSSSLTPVQRRMQEVLHTLAESYDFAQFTLRSFVSSIEGWTGRKIQFESWPMPDAVFGYWVTDGQTDYIFYDEATPQVHQAHIKLHELAHILCGHRITPISEVDVLEFAQEVFAKEAVYMRTLRSKAEEEEAETLTMLLKERIIRTRKRATASSHTGLDTYLRVMELT